MRGSPVHTWAVCLMIGAQGCWCCVHNRRSYRFHYMYHRLTGAALSQQLCVLASLIHPCAGKPANIRLINSRLTLSWPMPAVSRRPSLPR